MRVLFEHPSPFAFGHGGFQIQIEQTKTGLNQNQVAVEFTRWWDDQQQGDLIHYFGPASNIYLQAARLKNVPVVMTTLFTETCNRTERELRHQRWLTDMVLRLPFGESVKQQLAWRTYHNCTHNVVGLEAEKNVLQTVYRVPREKISVVPLGLSETFLNAGQGSRDQDHLICTGTIVERKRSVELAELALRAGVPILFVGKPYSVSDPYWKRFEALIDQRLVKYSPHVGTEAEMVRLLHSARGFVIMSRYENWCLSAHEAAACGLPLLLPNQNWSRERFGDQARYLHDKLEANGHLLREFYEWSVNAPPPKIQLFSWAEVGKRLRGVYESILSTSR